MYTRFDVIFYLTCPAIHLLILHKFLLCRVRACETKINLNYTKHCWKIACFKLIELQNGRAIKHIRLLNKKLACTDHMRIRPRRFLRGHQTRQEQLSQYRCDTWNKSRDLGRRKTKCTGTEDVVSRHRRWRRCKLALERSSSGQSHTFQSPEGVRWCYYIVYAISLGCWPFEYNRYFYYHYDFKN